LGSSCHKVTALLYIIVSPQLRTHYEAVVVLVVSKEVEVKLVVDRAVLKRLDSEFVAHLSDVRIKIGVICT